MEGKQAEIEAKFYLSDLRPVRKRVLENGGRLLTERHLERNWRFDRPGGELTAAGKVLRLRMPPGIAPQGGFTRSEPGQARAIGFANRSHRKRPGQAPAPGFANRSHRKRPGQALTPRLTFKRRGERPESRDEIEIEIRDPEAAVAFLEALGFEVVATYEKYRQTYVLGACRVMFDELPFGHFLEIEGPSLEAIRETAEGLGLHWERRVVASYLELYARLKQALDLPFRDPTFDHFARWGTPDPSLMSLIPAIEGDGLCGSEDPGQSPTAEVDAQSGGGGAGPTPAVDDPAEHST